MNDIFISYAKEDRARVAPLAKALADYGWTIWWDRTIPAGKTWREVIGEALESARSVVVVWSKASVKSRWVQEEADWGLERKILIPILLDEIRPPLGFGAVQAVDLVHWDPAQSSPDFAKLISDISIILGPSPKHFKEAEKAAEQERKRKEAEEEEHARKADAERKAQEEHKRKQEEERRKAEERRRLEQEQKRAEAERKAEEERKRKEVDEKRKAEEELKHRKAEEERKRKQGEEEAETARKEQVAREAEPGKSPAVKIGVLIALAVVIVAGAIMLFRQEPTRSGPEISTPPAKLEEPQKAPEPAVKAPKPEQPAADTTAAAPAIKPPPQSTATSSSPGGQASPSDAVRNSWLISKLYGSDNEGAALKAVRLTTSSGGYLVNIANQFGFTCVLDFNEAGNPAVLSNCASNTDPAWTVDEDRIPLHCSKLKTEIVCKGRYTLRNGGYSSPCDFTIARRLAQ